MKKEKSIQGITAKEFLPKAKKYLNTITKEEFMEDLKEQADIEVNKILQFIGLPLTAYIRDLDLDYSFKAPYWKRLYWEFQDWKEL